MKIAAFYCRVSTEGQEDEQTIESQIDEVEAHIKADGNILRDNLRFKDDGWSGELLVRPGLDAMRDSASRKEFEVLYVYDRGRLSRKFAYQELIIEELTDKGIEFKTLHDISALTPEEKVLQAMQGVFHEYERVKIAERMRRGKLFKVKNGILFGWQAPYGYDYIRDDDKGKFIINDKEAEVVRMIYKWVGCEGLTVRKAIRKLQELEIKPRKSKKGTWSTSTLSRLLRDETYIGTTYYNKGYATVPANPTSKDKYKKIKKSSRKVRDKDEWYALRVPVIIEKELFEKVQQQLVINNQFSMRNKKNEYLLSGLVYCSCGKKRSGEGNSKNGHLYYRCTDRVIRFPLPRECKAMGVNSVILDDTVWNGVSELLTNPELIQKQANRWNKKQKTYADKPTVDAHYIANGLQKIKEEEKRYLKAYGEGIITIDQYKEQLKELMSKKSVLEKKQLTIKETKDMGRTFSLPSNLEVLCDKITELLGELLLHEKQIVLRKTVDSVTTDGITATIKGYIPLTESEDYTQNVKFWSISRNCRFTECR